MNVMHVRREVELKDRGSHTLQFSPNVQANCAERVCPPSSSPPINRTSPISLPLSYLDAYLSFLHSHNNPLSLVSSTAPCTAPSRLAPPDPRPPHASAPQHPLHPSLLRPRTAGKPGHSLGMEGRRHSLARPHAGSRPSLCAPPSLPCPPLPCPLLLTHAHAPAHARSQPLAHLTH